MAGLSALFKRLKAIESRPSAQRPLRIVGGLPSGAAMIAPLAGSARTAPPPANAIDAATRPTAAKVVVGQAKGGNT